MGHYPLDTELFHVHQSTWNDHGHEEAVCDSVSVESLGDELTTGHSGHWVILSEAKDLSVQRVWLLVQYPTAAPSGLLESAAPVKRLRV